MDKRPFLYIKLLFVAVVLTFNTMTAYADKTVADLTGEDREMYDKFRHLFVNGSPDDFYSFAEEYSASSVDAPFTEIHDAYNKAMDDYYNMIYQYYGSGGY